MTAASGADCGPCAYGMPCRLHPGTDQPTLRDQLADALRARYGELLPGDDRVQTWRADADELLPLIERAKAEAAAEALVQCFREDHTTVAKMTPVQRLTCLVVKTEDMVMRAAALRAGAGPC